MSVRLRATLLACVMMSLLALTGCTVGIRKQIHLVMHDPIPIPVFAKGTVRIATNKPIPLLVDGVKDKRFESSVGGYVLVTPHFYDALVRAWNKQNGGK